MAKYPEPKKFFPKNKEKYVGDTNNIWYRSSYEKKVMIFFDLNESILKWTSETVVVPYFSKVDNAKHNYYVDFAIQYKTKDGSIRKSLIEVKPFVQTQAPKRPSRMTKRYMQEVETYVVNQAKWEAASAFAKKAGFDEFRILTEREIFGK